MLFTGSYVKTFVNNKGDWDWKECLIEIKALSLEDAIKKDKEYWSLYREPAYFEEIVLDTHMASIVTFIDREMPYYLAA